jgi:L-seryl-tRNA(Ser) seleniumtransferase
VQSGSPGNHDDRWLSVSTVQAQDEPRNDVNQRSVPSIEQIRQRPGVAPLERQYGRRPVLEALKLEADRVRQALAQGRSFADVAAVIEQGAVIRLEQDAAFSLRPVINATGVVIHTNLGRAPLSPAAAARAAEIASSYSNLEYDLDAGARGHRDAHTERLICRLAGAEAASVVNNNAAATLITLAALAAGREVIVSRGELVEIGGGFRVPEVMAQSGAGLREVGTTNRTRASDYAAAIGDRTAAILRVHQSNFRIEGFTERPTVRELSVLAHRFDIPLLDDLGSGYLARSGSADPAVEAEALRSEPDVRTTLAEGADVVLFSADKLLGGPQAGIIAGSRELVGRIRRHPLMRALRVDKMTYAALEATLQVYAAEKPEEVPVARMMTSAVEEIQARAAAVAEKLVTGSLTASLIDGVSAIGGGSAPGATLPTRLLQLRHNALTAMQLEARLRALDPPVIARIEDDHVVLDLRTVLPTQDVVLTTLLETLSLVRPS